MVDLFAGPGGLDVAARWMGISVAGVEWDEQACKTRRAAGLLTEQGDVTKSKPANYPNARILTGGPPCQTYTVAGRGAGRQALDRVLRFVELIGGDPDLAHDLDELTGDERTGLVLQPLQWILGAACHGAPYDTIVLEQVPSVLPVWEAYAQVLRDGKYGYKVACGILHTEEFGVPQTRRRAILIASRTVDVRLPEPTHRRYRRDVPQDQGDSRLRPWVSMGQALGRSDEFRVVSNYGTGGDPKARGVRGSGQPSFTVTGKVSRNRLQAGDSMRSLGRFTDDEAGRLQTFPPKYPWSGKDIGQQIGNAIPPRLAVHVLAAALGGEVDVRVLDRCVKRPWATTKDGVANLFKAPVGA